MALPTTITPLEFDDATTATQVAQAIEGQTLVVRDKQVQVIEEAPPLPYTTLDLLEDTALMWNWSARKTMAEAQILFEQGYITYPRTDATKVSPEAVTAARAMIVELYGEKALSIPDDSLLSRLRPFRRDEDPEQEFTEEAHEAIRPTDPGCLPGELEDFPPDAVDLYRLIWRHFLAAQMRPARYQVIEVSFRSFP